MYSIVTRNSATNITLLQIFTAKISHVRFYTFDVKLLSDPNSILVF